MTQRYPESLRFALEHLASWRSALARIAAGGTALATVFIGISLLGWLDLLADLPGGTRLGGLLLILVAAGATAAWVLLAARRERSPQRLAAAIDRHGQTGGAVLAGVDLAEEEKDLLHPVSRRLARAAARRAGRMATGFQPAAVEPADAVKRPWLIAACSLGVLLLVLFLWPAVFFHQLLRLVDPLGDHPPYAPYSFEVEPGDAQVFFGDPFSIDVRVTGESLPERVEWVIERAGRERATRPLLDRGEQSYGGTIAAVDASFHYQVQGPEGRSRRFEVTAVTIPRIDHVDVRVEPPAYTGKPAFEGPYPESGIAGVLGTRVGLKVWSNRPLSSGKLRWKEEAAGVGARAAEILALRPAANGEKESVEVDFEIVGDAEFEISVTDIDGTSSRESFHGKVVLLSDRKPTVAILEPPAESIATPDATVPIVLEAEDDFGLTRATVFLSLNGTRDHGRELELPKQNNSLVRLTHVLELGEWGLEPGDVLEFYATVADNDPAGAKTAHTKVHRLRFISQEQFMELVRQMERIDDLTERYRGVDEALQAARESARRLDEALEKLSKARQGSPESEAARNEAAQALAALDEALRSAAQKAREQADRPPVFEIDKAYKEKLEALAKKLEGAQDEQLERLAKLKKALAKKGGGMPSGASFPDVKKGLDKLRRELGESCKGFEEEVLTSLEALEKVYRLLEYEGRFTILALEEDDLALRTRRFGGTGKVEDPDESHAMRALADEQQVLEDELLDVIQGIRDTAARLPQGPRFQKLRKEAEAFATAVVAANAQDALVKAERSLEAREGRRAAADTRAAADLLLSFVKRGQGMGGSGKSCLKFQPKLAAALQSTLGDLLGGLKLPGLARGAAAGSGMGMLGTGGGSSAQANSLANMGLYGPVPTRKGGGSGKPGGDGGFGAGSVLGGKAGSGSRTSLTTDLIYGGVPIEAVPGEYRAAVREFFRTIATESGRQGK